MIKATDLFPDENELDRILKKLLEARGVLSELRAGEIDNAKKLKKEIEGLNETQASHRDKIAESATITDKIEKSLKKYNEGLNDNSVKLAAVRQATTKMNQVNKLEAKLLTAKEGSYNKLSAQYSLNKIALNQMSEEERKATKAGQDLEKQTAEIYEEMKRLQEATGKHTLSVGDYGKALKETPLGGFADGLESIKGKFNVLARHPIVAVMGLLVGAVIGLFKAFKKTEKGAEFFAKASGLANAALAVLTDLVDGLVTGLIALWEDPVESLKNFGRLLVENVINRIQGTITLAAKLGETLWNVVSFQFDKAAESAKEAGAAFTQAFTGLDADQQKDLAAKIKATTDAVEEQTKKFIRLESQKRRVRKANRALARSVEEVTTALELAQVAAGDTTTSFREQEDAAETVRQKLQEKAEIELKIARNSLSLLSQELKLRRAAKQDVEDLADSQLDAFREVKAAERALTVAIRENDKERAQIRQDRLEKDLDILIDGYDNQKMINERIIRDEKRSFGERGELLEMTQQRGVESFNAQIAIIEKLAGKTVDANNLIQESDFITLNQKIRALGLSEIGETRLLEVIRDRKTAVQDLKEAETELREEFEKNRAEVTKGIEVMDAFGDSIERVTIKAAPEGENKSIWERMFPSEQKDILVDSFSQAKAAALDFFESTAQRSAKALEDSNQLVATKTTEFAALASLAEQGYAVNVEQAQKEVELAKRQQAKKEQQAKRARKQQQIASAALELLNSKEQISNLVTATSKIWNKVGFPAAIPAIALMWGSFAASKIQAVRLSKKQFSKGGYRRLGKGTHASGNDTFLGVSDQNEAMYGERGEGHMIITPHMTNKYNDLLPAIEKHANQGTLEQMLFAGGPSMDTSRMEGALNSISRNTERSIHFDGQGRKVEVYKNLQITYND